MNRLSSTIQKTMWRDFKAALFNAVFPKTCLVCGAFFHSDYSDSLEDDEGVSEKSGGLMPTHDESFLGIDVENIFASYICRSCSAEIVFVTTPLCSQCGIMFDAREGENHLCGDCLKHPKPFGYARAVGIYEKTCMAMIHALKYRGKIQLATPLGMLLLSAYLNHWFQQDIDLIIPVPLHKKRLRERGFNQAHLLAGKMHDRLKQIHPVMKIPTFVGEGLIRERYTSPQTGLGREGRIANVKQVFRVNDRVEIDQKAILLIDDVYTTGATADACTQTLLRSGARRVDVLTLARTM